MSDFSAGFVTGTFFSLLLAVLLRTEFYRELARDLRDLFRRE